MGKVATMLTIMSGLMLLFYFTGLTSGAPNAFMTLLLNPSNFAFSTFWTTFLGASVALIVFGGFVASILYMNPHLIVMGALLSSMIGFLNDFMIVANKVISTNQMIGLLIFSPFAVLFVISIIEWWRGGD
jgi:hypothetical protein